MRRQLLQWLCIALLAPATGGADEDDDLRPCSRAEERAYEVALREALTAAWTVPRRDVTFSCTVVIVLNFRGEVLNAGVEDCPDDAAIKKSVEDAAYEASPLPAPENRNCRDRTTRVRLTHRVQAAD